jgi:phosphoglycerol transferase MdoB-like AlkP superfamily enzyme
MPDDVAALRSLYLELEGWQRVAAIAVLVLTALLLAAVLRPSRAGAQAALAALAPVALALWLAPASLASGLDRWVGNRVWDQRYNFETRGLVVHLVQETARYRARGEPPPTLQEVAEVVARLWPARAMEVALSADAHAARRNVHMIVLESFWDVRELAGAGLSEDPMDPRLRLLWEAGGAARALSPVFGGYTANAEFEALCGFPVSGDAVVFEGRLRRDAPCLPRHLAEAGYVTVAFHPNVAAFWNRVHAYRRSGFQLYWSERDFELVDMNREMLSDASLYRHKSRELIDFLAALREVDPDGIVIVFGDHLPFLGYEYAAYVESGLLAPERSRFIDKMFLTQVATPLLVLNGREGPVATGDLPIYRLPGLVLELLGDARPSPLTLTGTPPGLAVRPLPGMSLVVSADGPRACRPGIDDDPGCEEAAAWLAAVGTIARDLFAGRQHTLRSPMGTARDEPDPL